MPQRDERLDSGERAAPSAHDLRERALQPAVVKHELALCQCFTSFDGA